MATYKQLECMMIDDKEVAGERIRIIETEFPPEFSQMEFIVIQGTKYINKRFTSGSQEKL